MFNLNELPENIQNEIILERQRHENEQHKGILEHFSFDEAKEIELSQNAIYNAEGQIIDFKN